MIPSMFFGLGSAIGFGFADLLGAISARRIGVIATLFVIQTVDLLALAALLLTPLPGEGAFTASWAARLAIAVGGVLGAVSYFSFYRALQSGPVAVVSPVFASYAAVAVFLSVVIHGERLSAAAATGVALTIAGVVLASAPGEPAPGGPAPGRPQRGEPEPRGRQPRSPEHGRLGRSRGGSWGGVPFALLATLAWGVASYLVGRYAQETGWFLPVFGSRAIEFAAVGAAVLLLRPRGARLPPLRGAVAVIPAVSGLADVLAVSLFARASQLGLVSVAAAVSATFPLVVVAGGLFLFHERPSLRQWTGVGSTVAGLILLGLGR